MKVGKQAYSELAIQIATLDMKLNKILELLNAPEVGDKQLSEEDFDDENPTNWRENK
jgi:hypothetical protein